MAWSPDGRLLLTAGATVTPPSPGVAVADGSVDVWDLERGERAFTLHLGAPLGEETLVVVAFAPGGQRAVGSASDVHDFDHFVASWDLASGATTMSRAQIHYGAALEVSHDGKLVAAAGGGTNALVLELPALTTVHEERSDTSVESSMRFSKDDRTIVHVFDNTLAELQDPRSLQKRAAFQGTPALSADGASLAVFGSAWSGIVDARSGAKLRAFRGLAPMAEVDASSAAAVSPDGTRVAFSQHGTGVVALFDVASGAKLGEASGLAQAARLRWTGDSQFVLVDQGADDDSDSYVTLAAATMRSLPELPSGRIVLGAGHLALLADGARVTELDVSSGAPTGRAWDVPGRGEEPPSLGPDGRFFSYANAKTGTVRVVRLADGKSVELGVVSIGGKQTGFVASSDGTFDGPEQAEPCAPEPPTRREPGLLRGFLGAR